MCVVAGCSKRQTDDVSVHSFPKDERQRAAWTRFVKLTRADWTGPSQYTVICSEHFNEECYERQHFLMKDFGIPTKKRLVPGSVPSIYPKRKRDELNEAFIACPSPSLPAPTQERGAHAKRAKLRILSELLQENNTPSSHHEIQQTCNDQEDPALEPEEVATSSIACQTPAPVKVGTRSMKIQVGAKMKEKGSQADMRPRVKSIGVQCNGTDIPPLPRPDREPARNEPLSSSEESSETDSDHGSVYEPSSTGSEESQIQDDQNDVHNPLEETKFIVSKSKLMELFSACRRCHRHAVDCVQHLVGTMVKIVAECQFCGFSWQWCSQPYLGSIPAGNLGLSAGILFSGALAAKVLRVLQCMGVATITQRTFSSHQSSILFPSVARVWDKHQRDYVRMAEERGEPLVLGGDGRADSPGHCAKYGSIDLEQGIVVDIQLVQSNQVKKWRNEDLSLL